MVFLLITAIFLSSLVQAKGWETDFNLASSSAERSGKYMLLYFSGSDWCGWCKKLDSQVFSKQEFKRYAHKNLICVQLDFPRKKSQSKKLKKQNQELAMKYSVRGYPTVFILSPQGEVLERSNYKDGGAKKYVEDLQQVIDAHKKR